MCHMAFAAFFPPTQGSIAQINSIERLFIMKMFERMLGDHFYQPCLSVVEKFASEKIEMTSVAMFGSSSFGRDAVYDLGAHCFMASQQDAEPSES